MAEDDSLPMFSAESAILLFGEDYLSYLRDSLANAKHRVMLAQYLADARPRVDRWGELRAIAHDLARAKWRGVDVRLLLHRFTIGSVEFDANVPMAAFAAIRDVPVRHFSPRPGSKRTWMHAKFAVIDDHEVILGSHNLTASAFHSNEETSVAIRSADTARFVADAFASLWKSGDDVSQWLRQETLDSTLQGTVGAADV